VVENDLSFTDTIKNDGLLPLGRIYLRTTKILWSYWNRPNLLNELSGTWTELSDAVNLITNQNKVMNKTVNINLGMFFHIDEDAYKN
jgi:hypothetical protein